MNYSVGVHLSNTIKDFYDEDEGAKAILDWFSTRQNDASEVAVEPAAEKAEVQYSEALRVFRRLEEFGCGRLLMGRKGRRTRMAWDYSIRGIAAAAHGGLEEIEEIDSNLNNDWNGKDEDDEVPGLLLHEFQLRVGHKVQFKLPVDFSIREAERLAAFIRTLPFE